MELTHKLTNFGLTEKEAAVYLALLELDTSPVSDIARKAHINRSTTYVLLESLQKKGLVSIAGEKDNDVKLFSAAEPERLSQIAEEGAKKYRDLVSSAEALVPELAALKLEDRRKTRVRYFDGIEGVIATYEDTLTASEPISAYASSENMPEILPKYFPEYYARRAKRNIPIRSIHPSTPQARERMTHNDEELRTAAIVPAETYGFSPEIKIYDNKIVFMSLKEEFGIIIESQELADAMKKVFALSWKAAESL